MTKIKIYNKKWKTKIKQLLKIKQMIQYFQQIDLFLTI